MRSCFVVVVAVLTSVAAVAADEPWRESAKAEIDGRPLTVFNRVRAGSELQEVKGVGSFSAPPWVVKNVIDDVGRYYEFMPYTKTSKVISSKDGVVVSYQRLTIPLASDRDYTVKILDESKEDATGKITWKNRWTEANRLGPAPVDGVQRVGVNEGYWLLEELDGGKATKATYYVYTNPGGSFPAWLVNLANSQAVPELFTAVANQTKNERYTKTKPQPKTTEKKQEAPPADAPAAPVTP